MSVNELDILTQRGEEQAHSRSRGSEQNKNMPRRGQRRVQMYRSTIEEEGIVTEEKMGGEGKGREGKGSVRGRTGKNGTSTSSTVF